MKDSSARWSPPERRRAASTALALVAVAWVALLLSGPWLASGPDGGATRWWATRLYHAVGLICHQQVERSFIWSGVPFPVCGRCLALYVAGTAGLIGAAGAAWCAPAWLTWPRRPVWHGVAIRPELTWLLTGAAPAALLFLVEWAVADPGTIARAVGSFPLGVVVGWLAGRELVAADQ